MFVVGIAGPAQSGKSTIARELRGQLNYDLPTFDNAWAIHAFADPIKAMIKAMGINNPDDFKTKDHPIFGVTTREMYQTLGTEWAQGLMGKEVWIKALQAKLPHSANAIIHDVRFAHEANFIRNNGLLIHVQGRGGINSSHVSENPVRVSRYDLIIDNSGSWKRTLNQLEDLCEVIVADNRILRSCG